MRNAARVAVFDVLANKTSRGVLDACWNLRGSGELDDFALGRRLGAQTDSALRRLSELQLIDCYPRVRVRSPYLWTIVLAARRLPAGDRIFDVARNPYRCAVLEQLAAGATRRGDLNRLGRSASSVSQTMGALRELELLGSESGEDVVSLEDREQVLWMFLLVDQLVIDVHAAAVHPAVMVAIDEEHADDVPGSYERQIDAALQRMWMPGRLRRVRLVGDYPETDVEIELNDNDDDDDDAMNSRTLRMGLWSSRFGLYADGAYLVPPYLPAPHVTAEAIRSWINDAV